MQNTMKYLIATLLFAFGTMATNAQADLITWDDGGGSNDLWSTGANWSGTPDNTAPVNGDSVILTTSPQIRLDADFTIVNGESLTTTATGLGDELTLQTASVLTLATGGTMNIAFMRPRFSSGGDFNINAGASLDTGFYGLGSTAADITYIADAAGVTTWNNSSTNPNSFQIGADTLTVDLSSYSVLGTSSLTLVDYANADALNGTFASVTVFDSSGTLTAGVDYTLDYTTGSNITLNLTAIPEPSSIAMFGLALAGLGFRRRR